MAAAGPSRRRRPLEGPAPAEYNRAGRRRARQAQGPHTREGVEMAIGGERSPGWIDRLAGLYTPVEADVLDPVGYRDQAMLADVRPLFPGARAACSAPAGPTLPV